MIYQCTETNYQNVFYHFVHACVFHAPVEELMVIFVGLEINNLNVTFWYVEAYSRNYLPWKVGRIEFRDGFKCTQSTGNSKVFEIGEVESVSFSMFFAFTRKRKAR